MMPENEIFAPPPKPCKVLCLHCGGQFKSSEMKYEVRPEMSPRFPDEPFWYCPDAECDGAGFGFDLLEINDKLASIYNLKNEG